MGGSRRLLRRRRGGRGRGELHRGVAGEQELVDRPPQPLAQRPGGLGGAEFQGDPQQRRLVEPTVGLQPVQPGHQERRQLGCPGDLSSRGVEPGLAQDVDQTRGRRGGSGGRRCLRVHRRDCPPGSRRAPTRFVDEPVTGRDHPAGEASRRPVGHPARSRAATASATCDVPTAVGSSRFGFMS